MAKFLIAGGAGFIGSNLAEALCARGDSVRVLDDFSTGNRENLAHLAGKIEIIEGSIADLDICGRAVSGTDCVLHEAALPSVPRSVADPIETNEVNVNGTLNMLVAARDAGVRRFVYAASSSAYGNAAAFAKCETMPPNPLSPYALQKLTGEMYCQVFHRLYGLETVALRYFNVFGPRQDPASRYAAVIPLFVTRILRSESPVVYGDGEQSRDFTYVDNVVRANLLACESGSATAGQVFNVACGEQYSVNDLARIVNEILGRDVPIRYEAARPGDVRNSLADLTRARSVLGYEPVVSFREGLERVITWYERQSRL